MFPSVHRSLQLVSSLAAAALALFGCGGQPPEPDRIWQDFASEVWNQSGNISTDSISAPGSIGIESLIYGWRLVHPEDLARTAFEMSEPFARIAFFSADGEVEALEIEVSAVGKGALKEAPLSLALNGRSLSTLPLSRRWRSHRVEIPTEALRRGNNLLELRFPRPRKNPRWPERLRPRVRSLRFLAANGRPIWPQRPGRITLAESPDSESGLSSFQMPSPGWLEIVTRLPERARLKARFQIRHPPDEDPAQVLVYARLLDDETSEQTLAQERVTRSGRDHDFDVDLEAWRNQWVRIRLGVAGPGNALVSWQWAVVEGSPGQARRRDPEPIRPLPAPASGRLGRPDVLLILLDAARADAFSPFGGPHPTPAAERLAVSGTRFEKALAASSWTGQSVSSILTGLYPDTLGVGAWGSRLPSEIQTLAERLTQIGYRTVHWSQHPFYKDQADLKRGFQEVYRSQFKDFEALPSKAQLFSDQQPTFAFVHLMPPHTPYTPPPPYRGRYSLWYDGSIEPDAVFLNSFPNRRSADELSERDRRYIRDRYDENVAFADKLVANLLAMLDAEGRFEDSLVILLSDHGEAFLEHGRFLHTRLLHGEFLHVPLIIKWPAEVGGFLVEVAEPVSLVDIVPTLVDGLGAPQSGSGFQGRSLLPVVFDSEAREPVIWATTRGAASYQQPPLPHQMLQAGVWKILFDPLTDTSRLYQIEEDPGETRDLADEMPLWTLFLRQALDRQVVLNRELLQTTSEPSPAEDLDADLVEQLEALGYIE